MLSVPCLSLPQHVCRGGRVLEYELNICTDANYIQLAAFGGTCSSMVLRVVFHNAGARLTFVILLRRADPSGEHGRGTCKRTRCGKQSEHAYRTAPHRTASHRTYYTCYLLSLCCRCIRQVYTDAGGTASGAGAERARCLVRALCRLLRRVSLHTLLQGAGQTASAEAGKSGSAGGGVRVDASEVCFSVSCFSVMFRRALDPAGERKPWLANVPPLSHPTPAGFICSFYGANCGP